MAALDLSTAISANLLSPVVLCFLLGCIATWAGSDLKIPEPVYALLTIYLLFSLGLKGGVELSTSQISEVWKPALAALALGIVTPLIAYFFARKVGTLPVADSAALAAHYGSVSVVTFIAVQSFLTSMAVPFEGFLSTLVVILEIPGIVLALFVARICGPQTNDWKSSRTALHEIVTGKSILLLLGGLAIGAVSGKNGYARVEPFFGAPFQGVVALFLLEMGLVASRRFRDLKRVGAFVILFGIFVPLFNGALGLVIAHLAGLELGGSVVLATLAASASYIAAPAAVRVALPEANPGIYLTAALAVTFPFNLVAGIPLYFKLAQVLKEVWP